ncbi:MULTISPECIES: beta-ketoacyl-ACP synthase III [Flavobacterium]|jgi:3-oxoacyl-[acyl-carrier-protein] synthase-3|uniref:3-oxoacyl-[acyl-carrier-protein] synthase 3 n=1 Tax=Flavobacterium anhuiense TaxID=459526 RepID=A0AAC9CYV3_9FLAO|nr:MULTISPECIES: beta-ketoacyl-ACP synthase III [Flavobacterium]AOC94634.1 3-oxoacyl-[acyl-carrier-protein] synthase 3 [Flavobacterium anhuiense]EJG01043.1 3-oxoacyl-(acyl carrier protein) synthase III [Flavobacterium sp. F52]URM37951.1 beta-ketoacyl-ACP synthase III [Flavobacterium anhuiense]SCX93129.1 3-oxoacyl-[acyl-carrier-protein] synthase-3 [Flavobacterium anhuiense]
MFEVYITKAAKYLPNEAVSNDEMEAYLGLINDTASKARRIILRNNKITSRYYAVDKEGKSTHSNAELTRNAILPLFDENFTPQDLEVLSCGTSTPDIFLPSHAAMVHGLLKNKSVELNSSTGVCCAGMNSLKFGFLSIRSGNSKNAICTGSEKVSTWLNAQKYNHEADNLKSLEEQPIIAFKKDFLRWMLSDGAGAFLLENKPRGPISLKIEWMEAFSYAYELETCMYAGGDKLENGEIKGWSDYSPEQWLNESVFSIKQDVKLLDEFILSKGAESMKEAMDKNNIKSEDINYFIPHVSSNFFVEGLKKGLNEKGIGMSDDKWFMNLSRVGNVGSASIYLALEELMNSGNLKKGDKILLSVPESGRFSFAYAYLTVC